MKKTTKLNIWEVWNEYIAEAVYVDHKPTKEEIEEIIKKEEWPTPESSGYIHCFKQPIYQTSTTLKKGKKVIGAQG